jgi:arginyl-tRNA synthetase
VRALWKLVLSYSYAGQELTLSRLGNKWDYVWHESDHYAEGKQWVEEGLHKGVFKKGEEGAIVTDFSAYNIPDTVVIKSDGTSLYITQDLELTRLKKEKFHPDRMFWVIGPEQSLAMKQMFVACEQLGIGKYADYTHLSYGSVTIKGQGKMSSRSGNVLYIDDLIDDVRNHVLVVMDGEHMNNDEKKAIAEQVALGAVKYGFLRAGRERDIAFDLETAILVPTSSMPMHVPALSLLQRRLLE